MGKMTHILLLKVNYQYPSMIASSAIVGLIGLVISYAIAVPLGSAIGSLQEHLD